MHATAGAAKRPLSPRGEVDERTCAAESHAQGGSQHLRERAHAQICQLLQEGLHTLLLSF